MYEQFFRPLKRVNRFKALVSKDDGIEDYLAQKGLGGAFQPYGFTETSHHLATRHRWGDVFSLVYGSVILKLVCYQTSFSRGRTKSSAHYSARE